jgi:hypothetical protein
MDGDANFGAQLVVTFPSTHQALKFERDSKARKLSFQLMPVPRQISASCGLAAKVDGLEPKQLQLLLAADGVQYESHLSFGH